MSTPLPIRQKGFIFSNLFAMIVIGISKFVYYTFFNGYTALSAGSGIMTFSEFIILPILMGLISSWFWKDLTLKNTTLSWYSCLNSLFAILLSSLFLGEGVICLFIVSPLIIGFTILGAFLGRAIFKRNNPNINISVVSLLVFVFVADSFSKHKYENVVSDQLIIKATPDKIWKNVVAFEKIKEKNSFWLFKVGMPSPIESTVTGYYEGAGRKCIFDNGYVFNEKISTYHINHNLMFKVINQPRDPEIMGHIDILCGQFLLTDNGNGTTTLTGNSWYRLYVFPTWYYDIWSRSIIRNVHTRVMTHIKELSER